MPDPDDDEPVTICPVCESVIEWWRGSCGRADCPIPQRDTREPEAAGWRCEAHADG